MKGLVCQETKIVEKVVHIENEAYLARLLLVNSGGHIQWKVIDLVPIAEKTNQEILLLESNECSICEPTIQTYLQPITSPFVELLFFTSQPTRAPSLN